MKRAGAGGIEFRVTTNPPRISVELGTDRYLLAADEAYRLADVLVDAADDLTARTEARS